MRDPETERSADEDATAARKASGSAGRLQRGMLQEETSDRDEDLLDRVGGEPEGFEGHGSE